MQRTMGYLLMGLALLMPSSIFATDDLEPSGIQPGVSKGIKSVYTPLSGQYCLEIRQWEEAAELECPGIGGYRVIFVEDDARQTLNLIKDGQVYPLNFWRIATMEFSTLGKLIEWRGHIDIGQGGVVPRALIVRLSVGGKSSDLVVVDLTRQNKCVVSIIPPGKNQNQQARDTADRSSEMDCITPK